MFPFHDDSFSMADDVIYVLCNKTTVGAATAVSQCGPTGGRFRLRAAGIQGQGACLPWLNSAVKFNYPSRWLQMLTLSRSPSFYFLNPQCL